VVTGPSVEVLADTSIPVDARVAAAGEVGRLSAPEWPLGEALCVVALDHEDRGDVRTAAVRAMADTPAAAPNQLVRARGGVGRVPVRAGAAQCSANRVPRRSWRPVSTSSREPRWLNPYFP